MPREIQLIGQAYADESLTFSAQDTVNWLPVPDESGMARSPLQLRGLPGYNDLSIDVANVFYAYGALATARVATAYTAAVSAYGGTSPYKFSVSGGTFPPGLAINTATGAITGTPTVAGTYVFVVTVTDDAGGSASCNCILSVYNENGVAPPPIPPASTSPIEIANPDFASGSSGWIVETQNASPGFSFTGNRMTWRASSPIVGEDVLNNSTVILSTGGIVTATIQARCTAITGPTDDYNYVGISVLMEVFEDAACTIFVASQQDSFLRFFEVLDTRTIQSNISASPGQYIRASIAISASVPGTVEVLSMSVTVTS